MEAADRPDKLSQLRACKSCFLVKTFHQFHEDGCDNCGPDVTSTKDLSPFFEGMVSLMDPEQSWVGRWTTLATRGYKPGVYALAIAGIAGPGQFRVGEEDYEDDVAGGRADGTGGGVSGAGAGAGGADDDDMRGGQGDIVAGEAALGDDDDDDDEGDDDDDDGVGGGGDAGRRDEPAGDVLDDDDDE